MDREESVFRFEELRVYQKALDYVDFIYNLTKSMDNADVAAPYRKAAQAIALYIADGSGETKQQFITSLRSSKSALRDCVVLTTIAKRQLLINEIEEEESRARLIELSKMLSGFISSLQNKEKTIQNFNS